MKRRLPALLAGLLMLLARPGFAWPFFEHGFEEERRATREAFQRKICSDDLDSIHDLLRRGSETALQRAYRLGLSLQRLTRSPRWVTPECTGTVDGLVATMLATMERHERGELDDAIAEMERGRWQHAVLLMRGALDSNPFDDELRELLPEAEVKAFARPRYEPDDERPARLDGFGDFGPPTEAPPLQRHQ